MYSQTYVQQAHMGKPKSGCLGHGSRIIWNGFEISEGFRIDHCTSYPKY